jgi:phage recombination protein Bet
VSDSSLTTRPGGGELISADKIREYLRAFGLAGQLDDNEVSQFVEIATAYQLNPFKREIYCIPYGQGEKRKLSIIVGYESYLKRADRLGMLKGWRAWTEGSFEIRTKTEKRPAKGGGTYDKLVRLPVGDLMAKIEIHREGWDKPFEHEVYLDEYAQDNDMWASKPRTMLKKVCIAQAFRMCFPDEMGGMPYTSDELPDKMTGGDIPRAEDQHQERPPEEAPARGGVGSRAEPLGPPPTTRAPSGAPDMAAFVALINSVVPGNLRPEWMRKAQGGKDPSLLERLIAEIRATFSPSGPAATAAPEGDPDAMLIRIQDFITDLVPEVDRPWVRGDLEKVPVELEALKAFAATLEQRYGDPGLFG